MGKGLHERHTDCRCQENSVLVATECHELSLITKLTSEIEDRNPKRDEVEGVIR